MPKQLVIIPTYNEAENIEAIIQAISLLIQDFHVLVVDDFSPDGTYKIVQRLIDTSNQSFLHLIVRKQKSGLGTAYIEGFKWALANDYDFVFEMDADFSHAPKDLLPMFNMLHHKKADVVIGSRYVKGVNVVNWPMKRILMSWLASKYVKFITGLPINDSTAGFVGFRKEVLQKINLDKVKFVGYAFQIEMKFIAYQLGFNIVEFPVVFTDRSKGKSKMNTSIIWEAIFGVVKLKLKSWFGKIN
ncbi:polyprenol monophosphomannose synthase [Psychroflexus maritimus]|uniref:Polyprenol monophosphomannose synthase n=1 Tax=Psychroflexus maritimus TaxID=2714865 RepID=A0A967E0B8_9FLAO|nr:polyprenol monophosphomannose synthase [Psychroflexus maritimus]NGZ90457.1 polyprenol monophosphomannose synthase [Psychroflexus maritimus]